VLRGVATLLLYTCAGGAAAQFSGTLSVVSDYRYRGITFSDQRPAAQAGLAYDDPTGWFAGGFGSTVRLAPPLGTPANLQGIVYAGYAARISSGVNVEAGGDYTAFAGSSGLNYGEVFVGGAIENLSARIYYSPRYFGESSNAVYGEINASQPLVDRVRLHLHAGLLHYRYDNPYRTQPAQNIVDGRIGLRVDLDLLQLEIAWVGISNHGAAYFITGGGSPNGVVASVSVPF
jgi:uncharacterized protein (TIGR02001 family)